MSISRPARAVGIASAFFMGISAAIWVEATPPSFAQPTSIPGGPILSVPADPFMSAAEEQQILDLLSRSQQVAWDNTTPELVARELSSYVLTKVNRRALENMGMTLEMRMSLPTSTHAVPLGSSLLTLLESSDLTFVIRGGGLIITTVDDAGDPSNFVPRIYDVTPLVVRENAEGRREADGASLIDAIQTIIEPDTWEMLGGPSTMGMSVVRNRALLTVATTTQTHLKIQVYLDRLNSGPAAIGQEDLRLPSRPSRNMYPH